MNKTHLQSKEPDLGSYTAILEVQESLTSARSIRQALINLATKIRYDAKMLGYLLLIDPKLSEQYIDQEFNTLKGLLRQEIADRLFVVLAKAGKFLGGTDLVRPKDIGLLRDALSVREEALVHLPKPNKQDEVFLLILQRWLAGNERLSSRWIEDAVGCTYRTVASAIKRLGNAIQRHSDRSISVRYFPEREWAQFLSRSDRTRSTMYYADGSGQPRSPESLLRRFQGLMREDIAVGGVIGAKRHYPDLDLIGTPRLDLCIHCPGPSVNLDFVQTLDPALELTSDGSRPARLVIHIVRRHDNFFERDEFGLLLADPVECALGLFDAHLDLQGRAFLEFLIRNGVPQNAGK